MKLAKFLEVSPLFSLYTTYDQVIRDFQDKLKSEEIHFLQALILTGLFFESGAVRPSALADALKSTRSNISHALRDLEKKGLVERKTSEGDARAYFFDLTRTGKKKASRLIHVLDSVQEQLEIAGSVELNAHLNLFVKNYQNCRFPH